MHKSGKEEGKVNSLNVKSSTFVYHVVGDIKYSLRQHNLGRWCEFWQEKGEHWQSDIRLVWQIHPLNTSQDKIYQECANTDFLKAGIWSPNLVRDSSHTDKSKYYHFHRGSDHNTYDYIQLKDMIKALIKKGHLSRAVNESKKNLLKPSPLRRFLISVLVVTRETPSKENTHISLLSLVGTPTKPPFQGNNQKKNCRNDGCLHKRR